MNYQANYQEHLAEDLYESYQEFDEETVRFLHFLCKCFDAATRSKGIETNYIDSPNNYGVKIDKELIESLFPEFMVQITALQSGPHVIWHGNSGPFPSMNCPQEFIPMIQAFTNYKNVEEASDIGAEFDIKPEQVELIKKAF